MGSDMRACPYYEDAARQPQQYPVCLRTAHSASPPRVEFGFRQIDDIVSGRQGGISLYGYQASKLRVSVSDAEQLYDKDCYRPRPWLSALLCIMERSV